MPNPGPVIPPAILFVCLGNICRSPLAEAAFRSEAERAGLDVAVDSAGTGAWHAGEPPDRRAQAVARRNGVDISPYRACQVEPADYRAIQPYRRPRPRQPRDPAADAAAGRRRRVAPPRPCAGAGRRGGGDPYYSAEEGFDVTWANVADGARHLVRALRR